jgi:hypothetical protein
MFSIILTGIFYPIHNHIYCYKHSQVVSCDIYTFQVRKHYDLLQTSHQQDNIYSLTGICLHLLRGGFRGIFASISGALFVLVERWFLALHFAWGICVSSAITDENAMWNEWIDLSRCYAIHRYRVQVQYCTGTLFIIFSALPKLDTIYFDEHNTGSKIKMLCGAEEACWAHNPKVEGSKPSRATFFIFWFPFTMMSQNILAF